MHVDGRYHTLAQKTNNAQLQIMKFVHVNGQANAMPHHGHNPSKQQPHIAMHDLVRCNDSPTASLGTFSSKRC